MSNLPSFLSDFDITEREIAPPHHKRFALGVWHLEFVVFFFLFEGRASALREPHAKGEPKFPSTMIPSVWSVCAESIVQGRVQRSGLLWKAMDIRSNLNMCSCWPINGPHRLALEVYWYDIIGALLHSYRQRKCAWHKTTYHAQGTTTKGLHRTVPEIDAMWFRRDYSQKEIERHLANRTVESFQ